MLPSILTIIYLMISLVFHFIMTTEQKIRQRRNCMVTMQAI